MLGKATDHRAGSYMGGEGRGERREEGRGREGKGGEEREEREERSGVAVAPIPHTSVSGLLSCLTFLSNVHLLNVQGFCIRVLLEWGWGGGWGSSVTANTA